MFKMNDNALNSLEIKNFRAFDFLVIDRFERINLIIGKNTIGKSTLLEAIYLYANAGSLVTISEILINRNEIIKDLSKVNADSIFNLFHNQNIFEKISSDSSNLFCRIKTNNIPNKQLDVCLTIPFADPETGIITNPIPEIMIKFHKYPLRFQLNQTFDKIAETWETISKFEPLSSLTIPCNFITTFEITGNYLFKLWNTLLFFGGRDYVVDALRIIDPSITDFVVVASGKETPACYLHLKDFKNPIPAKTFGAGLNRLACISLALACSKDGILLIDEIENGLHWTVLPEVWEFIFKAAKRLNVQVFATTHSSDCLRAFHYGMRSDPESQAEVVRIERRSGKFHSEIFDEERMSIITREKIEIR
jgi:AAA15 family ATPase/GTPase